MWTCLPHETGQAVPTYNTKPSSPVLFLLRANTVLVLALSHGTSWSMGTAIRYWINAALVLVLGHAPITDIRFRHLWCSTLRRPGGYDGGRHGCSPLISLDPPPPTPPP
eukprot:3608042-Rhodomonas_salina.1